MATFAFGAGATRQPDYPGCPAEYPVASKGLEHRQQNDCEQEQDRDLVEKTIKHMAVAVAVIADRFYIAPALEVVEDQEEHPGQFQPQPPRVQVYQ